MENYERTVGTVQPGRYSGGVFLMAATMRRMHRAARRTLSCQASASHHWIQTICGDENRATCGCKVGIEATFRARWWRVREWRVREWRVRDERSLVWREIDAACESRISTSAVINSNHIEPRRFLEDAREIVYETL